MRTFCRFASKRRFVATIEWERLCPKAGRLPHETQTRAMRAGSIGDGPSGRPPTTVTGVPSAHFALPARYRVTGHVASGGMAAVYAAHDEVLGRDVAVKVLAEHL